MQLARPLYALAIALWTLASAEPACDSMPGIQVFGSEPSTTNSDYRTISCEVGFDSPKILPINDTSIDWWYFDAVAEDGISSLVIVFFLRGSRAGFPGPAYTGVPWIQVTGSFPNGTNFLMNFGGDEAILSTQGHAANGIWGGENHNMSFTAAPDLSQFEIELNSKALTGTFSIKSSAPPHYPCSMAVPGKSMEVVPGIGWANSIPDGDAVVDVEVNNSPLTFSGMGYHDKNWATNAWNESLGSWYWGHGRLGPYTLVWIDALTQEEENFTSGYAVRDGQILSAGCGDVVTVRPTGVNATYPPFIGAPVPDSYHLEMTLGDGTPVSAEITANLQSSGYGMYARWIGKIAGTVGNETYEGLASYEYFNFFGVEVPTGDAPIS